MLKFIVLLCSISCGLGAAVPDGMLPQLDGRIVGGVAANISDFPWQVSLQRGGFYFCGGSIYSSTIIVSAAHCVRFASPYTLRIRAGSSYTNSNGVLIRVTALMRHRDFNSLNADNDVAVIRLESSLTMSSTIRSISLASRAPDNGAPANVSGWGKTSLIGHSHPELRHAAVQIVSKEECASPKYGYGSGIKSSMICAYAPGKDACKGDSGGPLVSGNVLVGVVSWGYGCAAPYYPGVYANVAYLRSWIVSAAESV